MDKKTLFLAGAVIFLFIGLCAAIIVYIAPILACAMLPWEGCLEASASPCDPASTPYPSALSEELCKLQTMSAIFWGALITIPFILGVACTYLYYKEKKNYSSSK